MGDDDDMKKKSVFLARTLEWSEDGLGVRSDRRHVRSLLREMGMEICLSVSLSRSLTAIKEGDRSGRRQLSVEVVTNHRAAIARTMSLIQNRLYLGVTIVELVKIMTSP